MSVAALDALDDRDEAEQITSTSLVHEIDVRVELWHPDLSGPLEDITEWVSLTGSSLAYSSRASIRHSGHLRLTAKVDWNAYRVRPYVDITDRQTGATHTAAMGAYAVDSWTRTLGADPPVYDLLLVDVMATLDQPIGASYVVPSGEIVSRAIERAGEAAGQWGRFEPAGATDPVVPPVSVAAHLDDAYVVGSRIAVLGEGHTWLDVISHLAEIGGYRQPWMRRDGSVVVDAERATVATVDTPHVLDGARHTTDLRLRPNQWIIVGQAIDPTVDEASTERRLVYSRTDLQATTGEHSFDARGRRVIRSVRSIDAAAVEDDIAYGYTRASAFIRAAERIIDDDRSAVESVNLTLAPTSALWHDDVLDLGDAAGLPGRWRVTDWALPFDGTPMTARAVKVS